MKLTKEQKEKLAKELSHPWGHVKLMCDGYRIDLQVQRFKATSISYRIVTYVNGTFNPAWITTEEGEYPEFKFLRRLVRPNVSPTKKAILEKKLGKRYVKNDPYFSGSTTFYLPDWGNGKTAINHLCKVCDSVSLIEKTEPLEAI
ncbi:hypothetical protein [Iodobacter sp.]|uniref:hypothetical protein n=1 Tax=Iodobacter sp. TaxID=1915058 RepID=UPI0025E2E192|nr:hypothetical protein [Iodobacter sp.]